MPHHPLLLLALIPWGAMMCWAIASLREISAMQRRNERVQADLERRFPWLRDGWGRDG